MWDWIVILWISMCFNSMYWGICFNILIVWFVTLPRDIYQICRVVPSLKTVWKKLKKIEKYGRKITQKDITPLLTHHRERVVKFTKKILKDPSHPLFSEFQTLPSGRRLRTPKIRTSRFQNSFIPNSIKILNSFS